MDVGWWFLPNFMWWKRRRLNADETQVLSADFLREFQITPQTVLNGAEVFVLFRVFVNRYGRIDNA